MNNIQKYREKKGLTQRKLAEMVGTSQQQIQRFENNIPVKVEMAAALAHALGVSVNKLFPPAKAMATPHDKQRDQSNDIDETDSPTWTVKLLVRGQEKYQYYHDIMPGNMKRSKEIVANLSGQAKRWLDFDADNCDVVVNLKHVLLFQPIPSVEELPGQITESELKPQTPTVRIYLAGVRDPLCFTVSTDQDRIDAEKGSFNDDYYGGEFREVLNSLHDPVMPWEEDGVQFVDFHDQDGDRVSINMDDIAILEVAKCVLNHEMADPLAAEETKKNDRIDATESTRQPSVPLAAQHKPN
jgi:transcriptional regulator with XRE-family HTH domain